MFDGDERARKGWDDLSLQHDEATALRPFVKQIYATRSMKLAIFAYID